MPENTKYSHRDFSDRDLSGGSTFELYDHATRQMLTFDPATELKSGDTIRGSCFYQQIHAKSIFPAGVIDLELVDCNCDNVILPPGSTCEGRTCNKRIRPFPGTLIDVEVLKARKAVVGAAMGRFIARHTVIDQVTEEEQKEARGLMRDYDALELAIENVDKPQPAEDWFCDWAIDEPVEPLREKDFIDEGRSIDPANIPDKHIIEVEITKAEYDKVKKEDWETPPAKGDKPLKGKHQWFREVPKLKKTDKRTVRIETEEANWGKMQADNDYAPFDKKPKVKAQVQRLQGQGPPMPISFLKRHPEKAMELEKMHPKVSVVLEGDVTTYTVRGEGALYRGEGE